MRAEEDVEDQADGLAAVERAEDRRVEEGRRKRRGGGEPPPVRRLDEWKRAMQS